MCTCVCRRTWVLVLSVSARMWKGVGKQVSPPQSTQYPDQNFSADVSLISLGVTWYAAHPISIQKDRNGLDTTKTQGTDIVIYLTAECTVCISQPSFESFQSFPCGSLAFSHPNAVWWLCVRILALTLGTLDCIKCSLLMLLLSPGRAMVMGPVVCFQVTGRTDQRRWACDEEE